MNRLSTIAFVTLIFLGSCRKEKFTKVMQDVTGTSFDSNVVLYSSEQIKQGVAGFRIKNFGES